MSNQDRVAIAYEKNLTTIQQYISEKEIQPDFFELHLRAYKVEALLEVWIKNPGQKTWTFLQSFSFCTNSGSPGPKRREGDGQIPEGFYHIDRFNPNSKFHLSLGINYPNASDLILSDKSRPGSDIFIHGGCKSVGCIAITDEKIEALYVLATEAQQKGQQHIPVRIFPCKMDAEKMEALKKNNPAHKSFWAILAEEDQYFKNKKELLSFQVLPDGSYDFH